MKKQSKAPVTGVVIGGTPGDPALAGDDVIVPGGGGKDRGKGHEKDHGKGHGGGHDCDGGGLHSTSGNDWINGQAGNDFINGGKGNDIIIGGAGNDILQGGKGIDRLSGGLGADILDGGKGADFYRGGAGTDIFVWDDTDFTGVWTTVPNPFAVGSDPAFVLGGTHDATTTSTYAGNEGFDIIDATKSASGNIDLSGKNVQTVEAVVVKASNTAAQVVTQNLSEMRSENQSDLSSGAAATRQTVSAVALGNQAGDALNLVVSDGQPWVYNPSGIAVALSAAELSAMGLAAGVTYSLGNDGNAATVDLTAYVFTVGGASVTIWTDLDASDITLNAVPII